MGRMPSRQGGSSKKSVPPHTTDNSGFFPSQLVKTTPPSKLQYKNPVTVRKGCIWTIDDFFSTQECHDWIQFAEKECNLEYVFHKATRYMAHRECYRCSAQDPTMAHAIYERLLSATNILCVLPGIRGQSHVTCNSNLRLYKYTRGMSFGKHVDGSHAVDGGVTRLTILIYLSACEGGATRFEGGAAVLPAAGKLMLHVHGDDCLTHEGDSVQAGTKYILRTDLVYAKT